MAIKVVSIVAHMLDKHDNPEFAADVAKDWTADRRDYLLEKLSRIESSIDRGDHVAYRIAYNQLKKAIERQKETLDKLHEIMMFTDTNQRQR